MKGIDISHWQNNVDFEKVKKDGYDFVIAKCTQGNQYLDPKYKKNRDGARAAGLLFGAYHFANGTDPLTEAKWFVDNLGELKEGELVVLDWEIIHLNPVTWCKKFLDEVTRLVGFKPLFYTNSARLSAHDWKPLIDGNYGLWVAQYGLNICVVTGSPRIGKWPFYALWQYCSRGRVSGVVGNCDLNYTKMGPETLRKYGKPDEACTHCCPKHCD